MSTTTTWTPGDEYEEIGRCEVTGKMKYRKTASNQGARSPLDTHPDYAWEPPYEDFTLDMEDENFTLDVEGEVLKESMGQKIWGYFLNVFFFAGFLLLFNGWINNIFSVGGNSDLIFEETLLAYALAFAFVSFYWILYFVSVLSGKYEDLYPRRHFLAHSIAWGVYEVSIIFMVIGWILKKLLAR